MTPVRHDADGVSFRIPWTIIFRAGTSIGAVLIGVVLSITSKNYELSLKQADSERLFSVTLERHEIELATLKMEHQRLLLAAEKVEDVNVDLIEVKERIHALEWGYRPKKTPKP